MDNKSERLADVVKCTCNNTMFPFKFNKENKQVTYKCGICDSQITMTFDESRKYFVENDNIRYFSFMSDGSITWKCYKHGYCEYDFEWLKKSWRRRIGGFDECNCGKC